MEKYIKNLAIGMMLLTAVFFLSMFGAANAETLHLPSVISQTLYVGSNILVFIVPILFLVIFGLGMSALFKKVLNQANRAVKAAPAKFPTLWFVLSIVCFTVYYIFLMMIFNAPTA